MNQRLITISTYTQKLQNLIVQWQGKLKYPAAIILLSTFLFHSCVKTEQDSLTIATASNMQFAMKELTTYFTDSTGIACELIVGASGKLTAQIKEGAPFDVFISANLKYPKEIYNSGLAASSPRTYAHGNLVWWSFFDEISLDTTSLDNPVINHIAIANPETAPYGLAALEALQHFPEFRQVKHKLVYGESISQTNQFIMSKAAEVGITSKSIVLSPQMRNRGKWKEVDPTTYDPIEQGLVIIKKDDGNYKDAILFCQFLDSPAGQKILRRYGYTIDE